MRTAAHGRGGDIFTEISQRGRTWATDVVQWDPARNALKYAVHAFAQARGSSLERSNRLPAIANVISASSPRAGSQWMKAVFGHRLVTPRTGLFTLPQLDYQKRLDRAFPLGTYVPGLYASYEEYRRIPFSHPHRVVYMFRDPREVIVSGYFAAVGSHRRTPFEDFRNHLRTLPVQAGLTEVIHASSTRLREIASWVGVTDENVAMFRLEDVVADPYTNVVAMLKHVGVELDTDELVALQKAVSRAALQHQDLMHRAEGEESHYRRHPLGFRELFTPEHHEAIEAAIPGVIDRLGYR